MSRAAVIGEAARTAGFALAGALVLPGREPRRKPARPGASLPADIAVLVS